MIMDIERHIIETKNYEKYHVNLDLIYDLYYNKNEKLSKEQKELLLLTVDDKKEIEKIVKGDDTMEKAKDKLIELSENEELVGMYDKELMDKKIRNTMIRSAEIQAEKNGLERGLARGTEQGIKQGIKQGIELGIEQGTRETQKEVVINMLKEKLDISIIKKITGLSEKQIIDIKNG